MSEQKLVKFKLNDRELEVPAGTLVIEAAKQVATEVPSFCYYPGLSLQAACRMCLVEVEKMPKLQTACTLVATEGMVVRTDTPQIKRSQEGVLEFLLTNHPLDCPVCDKGGECELQDMVFRYGADTSRFVEEKIHRPEEKWSELVYYDAPRCVLCFPDRAPNDWAEPCQMILQDIVGRSALYTINRALLAYGAGDENERSFRHCVSG